MPLLARPCPWWAAVVMMAAGATGIVFTPAQAAPSPSSPADQAPAAQALPAIAFYRGERAPIEALSVFDQVVLSPAKLNDAEMAALNERQVEVIARLGGPEIAAAQQPAARAALLDSLDKRGFAGLLLDGRDDKTSELAETLLFEARRRKPGARLYFWGKTRHIPEVAAAVSGFVTDGVFTGGTPSDGSEDIGPVQVDDLEGVRRLAELLAARGKYRFPMVVVERVPNGQREQARGIARTLVERGFVPWVVLGGGTLGIGLKEWVPRKILALYDGQEEPDLPATVVHRLAAMPLEHLGYALDYHDISGGMPTGDLGVRYAGIVSWFTDDEMAQPRAYENFLAEQLRRGLRIAMLGRPGFRPTTALLGRMSLQEINRRITLPVTIHQAGSMIGYEARPLPLGRDLPTWQPRGGDVHLELRDSAGLRLTPVMTGHWGGMALDPYLLSMGYEGRTRWIVDPFSFFTRALDLEPIPVPDFTTENGRRLLFIHIDGDGFPSMVEMPGPQRFSGQLIRKEFLERYPFPTTVSIIEGDTSAEGMYPQLSAKLEQVAREIFALPNVELASHAFSHPFDWGRAARGETMEKGSRDPVHYAIPGYKYSAAREVGGSIKYINERLAPPNKPARVFLWSGSALPGVDALKEIAANRLYNMNGGPAELPNESPVLSQVPGLGRFVGGFLQVYAQAQNENVYTNEWRSRYYGFRDVVNMFRFTETPRRLKPIDVYYHFYSGTKPAAITALHEVYQYVRREDTMPIVVSEMVAKASDFYRVTLTRRLEGTWEIRGLGALRTLRLDKRLGWPAVGDSIGVVGVDDGPSGRYVALSGAPTATLALAPKKPTDPHLAYANATLQSWSVDRSRVRFRLRGHVPVVMALGGCNPSGGVDAPGARVRVDASKRTVQLSFGGQDTREVSISCR
jgi:polysaccharide biosynthesis protein PelA